MNEREREKEERERERDVHDLNSRQNVLVFDIFVHTECNYVWNWNEKYFFKNEKINAAEATTQRLRVSYAHTERHVLYEACSCHTSCSLSLYLSFLLYQQSPRAHLHVLWM